PAAIDAGHALVERPRQRLFRPHDQLRRRRRGKHRHNGGDEQCAHCSETIGCGVMDAGSLVDLDRFSVARHRAELRDRGVSVLPGFVRPTALASMVDECNALAPHAHLQDVQGTPYLELPDDTWPEGHPRVTWSRSSVHTIGYDQFPSWSVMRAI